MQIQTIRKGFGILTQIRAVWKGFKELECKFESFNKHL